MRGDDRIVPTIQIVAGGIATALADLGMSYLRLVLSPSAMALFRVVVAEAPRFPDVGRRFYLTGPKVVNEKIAACLTEAAQAGEVNIQSIGAGAAASLFISMVRGEAQLECLPHPAAKPSAAQMDIWVQNAVTTFLGAYGAAKLPSG
ncbi:TetR/AcrR family transcriptional regulator C-terminal domain-containing protein [Methylobacillus sp.]|uniref:TetR/AcrR family transcriptional regulator C-terminal domain-containing protein n=1 Tax=Methylobacillus sp. TaxID=56818 RepID=UPI002FE01257